MPSQTIRTRKNTQIWMMTRGFLPSSEYFKPPVRMENYDKATKAYPNIYKIISFIFNIPYDPT